ncbi:polyphenol oxidase family protein [Psychrobacter sp. FDAARGOS_221]|uniref:polyphenol oxidase family protein n=1 Tax=Psychrobacter sp. FDAARGOS_221 TaxID=1975705 RepID=UPI000BB58728|nr:polyphenol oxidase family protein [Psychrobacter sp. FDAARGOS_221]PNK59888.1 laccase domain-containing protein [Psychrobacter sp. FDAARGOS_221]
MKPTTKIKPVYDVLAQTPDILIVQTNAGEYLTQPSQSVIENKDTNIVQASSFGRFNLGLHVNDNPQQVLANRAQLLSLLNQHEHEHEHVHEQLARSESSSQPSDAKSAAHIDAIYWLSQIHSNKVVEIDDDSRLALTAPKADALVTQLPNQALAIMTADCVPIVLYNPNTQHIAAIHAGWQGLANGVIASCYAQITGQPSTQQQPIQAWMGICISQNCYEVSSSVVEKLLAGCEQLDMDVSLVREEIVGHHDNPDKAWLDLPKLAQLQLKQLGVELQQSVATETSHSGAYACSYSDSSYYSYRRQTHLGVDSTGRMAMLIMRLQ